MSQLSHGQVAGTTQVPGQAGWAEADPGRRGRSKACLLGLGLSAERWWLEANVDAAWRPEGVEGVLSRGFPVALGPELGTENCWGRREGTVPGFFLLNHPSCVWSAGAVCWALAFGFPCRPSVPRAEGTRTQLLLLQDAVICNRAPFVFLRLWHFLSMFLSVIPLDSPGVSSSQLP